ncbi:MULTISPECIES: hypothetical protein [Pseudomonas]|uniref:Glycine zipper domain-containing protein n=1 Tax=Pseudomonas fluorescens LMG 5329 TaxID=1324332 RepID=A0A0A1Z005_PSEFL|nr:MULTISPECIES: hypothetical protein [Pseudomonas]KGE67620.1 hypothetical protein K814_0112530 [Pseudomonas fluorescens LMG 5329]NWE04797.1 hypothetical protein [Pseudomonas sp. IPO3749]NWF24568.1 hypothetical protein [Pseudomonas sp. IPO3749]
MKSLPAVFLLLLATLFQSVQAAEVLAVQSDHKAGQVFGGLAGVMAGAVAGGPLGAIAGAALGALLGGEAQESAGLGEASYRVKTDSGTEQVVRSPGTDFQPGDRVLLRANRLIYPEQQIH